MSETAHDGFEALLREALSPVEPPADLAVRLESALESITGLAAEELEAWELSAMRDPRNWARPAAALVAGSVAGAALVVLRARRRAHQNVARRRIAQGLRWPDSERSPGRMLRDLGRETRRRLGER
jgi:hypothetical protein